MSQRQDRFGLLCIGGPVTLSDAVGQLILGLCIRYESPQST